MARYLPDMYPVIDFEPSRVRSGKVARAMLPGEGDLSAFAPEDRREILDSLRDEALRCFIDGSARCPFVQRQALRGRDAFPSRDPADYRLREVSPGHYAMEAKP